MAQHNQLGKEGERIALFFLKEAGYTIVATNWRHQKAEIDLIIRRNDNLIFVEVKTRSSIKYGHPAEFITLKKQTLMQDAAEAYLLEQQLALDIRFDVISIIGSSRQHTIEHIKNAF